jgi:hypothetical protein
MPREQRAQCIHVETDDAEAARRDDLEAGARCIGLGHYVHWNQRGARIALMNARQ